MRKWLLLILILPLAAGQDVFLGYERDLPLTNFDVGGGPTPDVTSQCLESIPVANAQAIRFSEDASQTGCGWMAVTTSIPEGTSEGRVLSVMDRGVDYPSQLLAENSFLQQLKVTDASTTRTYTIFGEEGASQELQEVTRDVRFHGEEVTLTWYLEDRGFDGLGAIGATGISTGTANQATLTEAAIQFTGLEVPFDAVLNNRLAGNSREQFLRISVEVQQQGSDRPFLDVQAGNNFTFTNLVGPSGDRINAQALNAEGHIIAGRVHLPADMIQENGFGTYVFEFNYLDPVEESAYLGPITVLAFIFPLAGVMFSYREYRHTRYRIGDDPVINSGMSWLWRATVGVILLTIGWILASRRVVGMLFWPPGVEQVLYYAILIGTGAFMFLFMFLWRRQTLMVALDQEIHVRRRTQSTLERSNRDLEMFAYVASHDMKQPLRMVKFYTRRLKEKYGDKLDSDAKDYIDFAADNAERMEALVQGLLEYSRVDSASFSPKSVDMNKILEGTTGKLQLLLEETGGELTWDDLGEVQGNHTQLSQLLQNLVENGLKYRSKEPPRIHVARDGNTFEVRDNGKGIAKKDRVRIFQLFKQLDVDHDGEGIGLALCRRIVEKHGGTLDAKDNPGGGTIMSFSLQ